jgi:hypothetical protein
MAQCPAGRQRGRHARRRTARQQLALRRTAQGGGAWACGVSERRSVGGRVREWRVIEGMDGWWDGWLIGSMSGEMVGWMDGCIDGLMDAQLVG